MSSASHALTSSLPATPTAGTTLAKPGAAETAVVAAWAESETLIVAETSNLEEGVPVTKKVKGGKMSAVKISASGAASGGAISVPIPDSKASVVVPTSAFAGMGPPGQSIVLVITTVNMNTTSGSDGASVLDTLRSAPTLSESGAPVEVRGVLNVNLFWSSGSELVVRNLEEPILLTLPLDGAPSADMRCAYFDEEARQWKRDGVERVGGSDQGLVCATRHLSMFGAVIDVIGKALMCSNAEVLTAEGISRIAEGTWWHEPAFVLLCVFFLLHVALVIIARRKDQGRRAKWTLRDLVISDGFKAPPKKAIKEKLRECHGEVREKVRELKHAKRVKKSFLGWLCFHGLVRLSHVLTEMRAAGFMWMRRRDVKKLRKRHRHADGEHPTVEAKLAECPGQSWLGEFESTVHSYLHCDDVSTFVVTLRAFIVVLHPWALLFHKSIEIPGTTRALLLMSRVMGSFMVSALFFSASGSATSDKSPEECKAKNIGEAIGLAITVGIISSILASLPIIIFGVLFARDFVYIEAGDDARVRKKVKAWRLKELSCRAFCVLYSLFCFFFAMAFLANVSSPDASKWIISCAMSIVKETLVIPVLFAIILAVLYNLLKQVPDVKDRCKDVVAKRATTIGDLSIGSRTLSLGSISANREHKDEATSVASARDSSPDAQRWVKSASSSTGGWVADASVIPVQDVEPMLDNFEIKESQEVHIVQVQQPIIDEVEPELPQFPENPPRSIDVVKREAWILL